MVLWKCEAPHSLEVPEPHVQQLGGFRQAPGFLAGVFPVPKEPRSFYHTLMAQRSLIVSEFWALSSGTRDKGRKLRQLQGRSCVPVGVPGGEDSMQTQNG